VLMNHFQVQLKRLKNIMVLSNYQGAKISASKKFSNLV
jgi:hypothetical protein